MKWPEIGPMLSARSGSGPWGCRPQHHRWTHPGFHTRYSCIVLAADVGTLFLPRRGWCKRCLSKSWPVGLWRSLQPPPPPAACPGALPVDPPLKETLEKVCVCGPQLRSFPLSEPLIQRCFSQPPLSSHGARGGGGLPRRALGPKEPLSLILARGPRGHWPCPAFWLLWG